MQKSLFHKDLPVVSFASQEEFYTWLGRNHTQTEGFWLRYYKKGTNIPTIVHAEAVEVALCWGWIDGLANKYDDVSYLIRFTPRRKKSIWSQINVQNVQRLTAAGLMQPSGLVHVEAAKADGRWQNAYAGQATMDIPPEFKKLLKQHPVAEAFYASLNKANKYAIAFRLSRVLTPQKRELKMQEILAKLLRGESYH